MCTIMVQTRTIDGGHVFVVDTFVFELLGTFKRIVLSEVDGMYTEKFGHN